MDSFPLQPVLIDAVIDFANAEFTDSNQVTQYFPNPWTPTSVPKLKTCRKVQREVRAWLAGSAGLWSQAVEGLDRNAKPNQFQDRKTGAIQVDKGIRLEGRVQNVLQVSEDGELGWALVWEWALANASLRAVCALAIATIYVAGLEEKIGRCPREGSARMKPCTNFFIAHKSRGKPRKYCTDRSCELELNKQRVEKSRRGKAKA